MIDDPFGRLQPNGFPAVLQGWQLKYIVPSVDDYLKCLDLCGDLPVVDMTIAFSLVPHKMPVRYYLSKFSSTIEPEMSFCDAYGTYREAVTEALRGILIEDDKSRLCEFYASRIGMIKGYGKKYVPFGDIADPAVQICILADDLSPEIKTQLLTVERFGADVRDTWYIMAVIKEIEVTWL